MEQLNKQQLIGFYHELLLPRLIEERMLISLRQGKISKWFSAWGQEAISVGAALALHQDEYIFTMHRNLGVFTSRKVPLERLFSQFQGKMNGFTKGRDRSFHFGTKAHKIIGMISHLGSQMGVANGVALANLLSKNKQATLVFTGDGGASEGDFHEALNVAAVWQLPIIIVIENNQWGLSTPSSQQFKMKSFADKGVGYGIDAVSINGNDLLAVYSTIKHWANEIRKQPKPVLIECNTFRMRGHEEASGTAYYPNGIIEKWQQKDPVQSFEDYLLQNHILTQSACNNIKNQIKEQITTALAIANQEADIQPSIQQELEDVYAGFNNQEKLPNQITNNEQRFVDAIADALRLAMEQHPNLILMGQDIAEYGGVFKVTETLVDSFGKERVRNTPLCESAIVGTALGLSIAGYKSMVEMQFADFVTEGFNQIVNNLAKSHYRWQQNADVVIRMPTGGGVAAGPFHSQSTEAWFTKVPGLKVVYPATPEDAKGLLLQSFLDPNPVMFFEHKKLYRSIKSNVPKGDYKIAFGKARKHTNGNELTIVTYGLGVHMALDYLKQHPTISCDLIDLRTLVPWDKQMVLESVTKTGKLLVLHEDTLCNGFGAEIASVVAEECFEHLDAPIQRVGAMNTPVPFNAKLEQQFMPTNDLSAKIEFLIHY